MEENAVYSQMYLTNIIVENQFGYHLETLWYGGDTKNLCLMIMDVMNSWYLPNKLNLSPKIVKFYERIEANTKEDVDPSKMISFNEMNGEMFRANGLRLEVQTTNNLVEMFDFLVAETFNIYAKKGEKAEDFTKTTELIEYLLKTYEIDEQIKAMLTAPDERTISEALYAVDIKLNYSARHYRAPKK